MAEQYARPMPQTSSASPIAFSEPTESEWLDLIAGELRGRDIDSAVRTTMPGGERLRAFGLLQDQTGKEETVRRRSGRQAWKIRESADSGLKPDPSSALVVRAAPGATDEHLAAKLDVLATRPDGSGILCVSIDAWTPPAVDAVARALELVKPTTLARVGSIEIPSLPALSVHELRSFRAHVLKRFRRLPAHVRFMATTAAPAPAGCGSSVPSSTTGDSSPSASGDEATQPAPDPHLEAAASLAWTFAETSEWMTAATEAGMDTADIMSRLLVRTGCGPDFLVSIAQLRALRFGLETLCTAFGGRSTNALAAEVHVLVSEAGFRSERPETNLVRATIQLAAAVAGGADAVEIPPYDAPVGATSRGHRLSRNLHHVLRDEGLLHMVSDPGAGSYYLERLTDILGRAGWSAFRSIEKAGGLDAASEPWRRIVDTLNEGITRDQP